eukprot:15481567-Alexandrium_andersonii.AAC.1
MEKQARLDAPPGMTPGGAQHQGRGGEGSTGASGCALLWWPLLCSQQQPEISVRQPLSVGVQADRLQRRSSEVAEVDVHLVDRSLPHQRLEAVLIDQH